MLTFSKKGIVPAFHKKLLETTLELPVVPLTIFHKITANVLGVRPG
jgi:hypothetical protein